MKRPLISLIIIFFAVVFSLGQDRADKWMAPARAAAKKNPVAANETSIALGRKIYERQCLACHGLKAPHVDVPSEACATAASGLRRIFVFVFDHD